MLLLLIGRPMYCVIFICMCFNTYRIALLQRQLLEVRDKMGYAKFQYSHKPDGPSDSDRQELNGLEKRERNILDKIADAKRQIEREEIDDSITVGYQCDQCKKSIEGTIFLVP